MTKYQRKTCRDCGGRSEVIDGICSDCEENYVYCTVCQEHLDDDYAYYKHRHLWQNECGEWIGPGGPNMTDYYREEIRQSFFAVLKKTGIAEALARTIRNGRMGFAAIHLSGSIFGYDSVWCGLDGEPSRDTLSGYALFVCGDRFTENLTDEQEEAMGYGVHWLIGLDNDKTPEANALTLLWIGDWSRKEPTS